MRSGAAGQPLRADSSEEGAAPSAEQAYGRLARRGGRARRGGASCSRRKGMAQQQKKLWQELLLLGASLACSAGIMMWAIDKLDPQRDAKIAAKKRKRELQTRLGVALELNSYEEMLAGDVINPAELSVTLKDIGGLSAIVDALHNKVIAPLQRPHLFSGSPLLKPSKGVLLYGPPGTGKTMLAKAVASESGANFINVSMSTLASKWFGEGEKYVRALFTLAHKIAPSVVFVDEVDSMLGRRDKTGEHEAMRKIKNEFMSNWDGLKTSECDRVLVLAATNRPFDLDEAVIRRLPRRLLVDLPDVSNRVTILRVILKDEELEPEFDFEALAALTEGYTGSDLRNLCIAAAYRPIRDFLEAEKKEKEEAARKGEEAEAEASPAAGEEAVTANKRPGELAKEGGPEAKESGPEGKAEAAPVQLRPLTLDDLVASMDQICPSNSSEAASMTELRQWNDLYGEGGSRKKDTLTYFM
mmetsp:Transcript_18668/g.47844  ORF Transcript_18668/g.47844 Transcript_18668/m.47844 type:complete len:471 (-) Transcript_18668:218-1630(-)